MIFGDQQEIFSIYETISLNILGGGGGGGRNHGRFRCILASF